MDEGRPSTHPYLKAKIQIGSSAGPVSFQLAQTVFHHDDVPVRSRIRTEAVKDWKRSKILDTNRSVWNKSSHPNNPVCERRQMENFTSDRSRAFQYNYRAETLDSLKQVEPLDVSTKFHISTQLSATAKQIMTMRATDAVQRGQHHRTLEMPIHPSLEDVKPWNNTTILTIKQQHQGLDAMTQHATQWSHQVNSTLAHKKEYIGPMQAAKLAQEKIRQLKAEGRFSALNDRAGSEPVDRKALKNRFMVGKLDTLQITTHSGVWGPNIDGMEMWSDTGSYEFASRGDLVKKVNLDQQNYADPVKPSRRLLASGQQDRPHSKPARGHSHKHSRQSSRPGSPMVNFQDSLSSGSLTHYDA